MRTKTEKELRATEELIEEKASEAEAVLQKAEDEDRDPSEKEMEKVTDIQKDIKNLKERRDDLQSLVDTQHEVRERAKGIEVESDVKVIEDRPQQAKSFGEQFTSAEGYKRVLEKGLSGEWSTGAIHLDTKGTLFSTPGTALTPAGYQPGVVETLYQAPTVADLMPSAQTNSSVVRYVREGSGGTAGAGVTNSAAGVAEGADKPESALSFEEVSENVKKIATVLPVSDEMLEDAAQIESYINQRLTLFVRLEEDAQLLDGGGTNDLEGILGRTGVNTWGRGTVDNYSKAIFKAANGTRGSAQLNVDGLVINPADWQTLRLETDSAGQFFGGGPYYGPYGGPQGPASANQFMADPPVWGLRTVVTSAIGSGTALVGSFSQAAQVFRRSGITVEASNSHSDFFVKNLTAIRAEERLALAVYRPGAFTKVVF